MVRHRSQVMVGRDHELEALDAALSHARRGEGRLVLVNGEAGLGKSRLVSEFLGGLDDVTVITGHGVDMSTGEIPFGTLADTLRDLGPQLEAAPEATRAALASLLPGQARDISTDRVGLVSAALWLIEQAAAVDTLIWVIEDLHWVDAGTRDLLSLITRSMPSLHLLVLATCRSEDPDRSVAQNAELTSYLAGLTRQACTENIRLARLGADEVRQLLAGLREDGSDSGVDVRITRLSDGIPFVVEELAAARGRSELTSAAEVATLRLQVLSPEARRLVEAAAVGDGHLRLGLVEEVLDHSEAELDAVLGEAIAAGILAETPGRDGLAFRHALLRDAVDRATTPGARRGWHRRWAEVLSTSTDSLAADPLALAIAEHWHSAGDIKRSCASAAPAAAAAGRMGAGYVEADLWERMLRHWDTASDELLSAGVTKRRIFIEIQRVLGGLDKPRLKSLEPLLRSAFADDPVATAALDLLALRSTLPKGSWPGDNVPEPLRQALREALEREPVQDGFTAECLLLLAGMSASDDMSSLPLYEQVIAWARTNGDVRTELNAVSHLAFRHQVDAHLDEGAAVAEAVASRPEFAHAYEAIGLDGNLTWVLGLLGRHPEAERAIERGMARVSDPRAIAGYFEHLLENAMFVWTLRGEWSRSRPLIAQLRPYWSVLTLSEVRQGYIDLLQTGTTDVEILLQPQEANPNGPDQLTIDHVLALESVERGDNDRFRDLLTPHLQAPNPRVTSDMLWTLVRDGARVEADAALDPAQRTTALAQLEIIESTAAQLDRFGALGDAWSLELSAQLALAHGEPAADLMASSREAWVALGQPYDAALVGLTLASIYARECDRSRARTLADQVLAGATALGAGPLMRRTTELLARLGGTASPIGRLTARESEVLALLAEGRTNEQIAGELFMSPKTASVHVSRIMTKLGASNRTEAAAIARRESLLDS